jgi:hypothetical protein
MPFFQRELEEFQVLLFVLLVISSRMELIQASDFLASEKSDPLNEVWYCNSSAGLDFAEFRPARCQKFVFWAIISLSQKLSVSTYVKLTDITRFSTGFGYNCEVLL